MAGLPLLSSWLGLLRATHPEEQRTVLVENTEDHMEDNEPRRTRTVRFLSAKPSQAEQYDSW
jgi:hypothetical protein